MRIGYARVSTLDQSPDLQLQALAAAGCEKVYGERASGGRTDRPELSRVLNDVLRPGDTLVVWKLDRHARSLTRHGYDVRTLADQFNVKPVEIKAFLTGALHAERT